MKEKLKHFLGVLLSYADQTMCGWVGHKYMRGFSVCVDCDKPKPSNWDEVHEIKSRMTKP